MMETDKRLAELNNELKECAMLLEKYGSDCPLGQSALRARRVAREEVEALLPGQGFYAQRKRVPWLA